MKILHMSGYAGSALADDAGVAVQLERAHGAVAEAAGVVDADGVAGLDCGHGFRVVMRKRT